ncbi:MAG: OmpH family outer membrane protein [Caulobacteraceae bacterium]
MNSKFFGTAAVIAFTGLTASAFAQSRTASGQARPPGATAAIAQGPAIPGMCVLSQRQAIGASTVGRYVNGRMTQIVSQWKAELTPEQTAIENDAKALGAARATLDANTYQSRQAALQARAASWQQKLDLRQRETQATERKSVNRIAQELSPIVQQLYQQRRCSLLIDADVVLGANTDMDLTAQAIAALNARITQFSFDRERLDTAGAPAR